MVYTFTIHGVSTQWGNPHYPAESIIFNDYESFAYFMETPQEYSLHLTAPDIVEETAYDIIPL